MAVTLAQHQDCDAGWVDVGLDLIVPSDDYYNHVKKIALSPLYNHNYSVLQ